MFSENERVSFSEVKARNPELSVEDDLREIITQLGGKLVAREENEPFGDIYFRNKNLTLACLAKVGSSFAVYIA